MGLSSVTKGTWAPKKPTYPCEGYVGLTLLVHTQQKTTFLVCLQKRKHTKSVNFLQKAHVPFRDTRVRGPRRVRGIQGYVGLVKWDDGVLVLLLEVRYVSKNIPFYFVTLKF